MDPIGLSLENFDGVGAYRTTDHGMPLDLSGDIDGHAFVAATGMSQLLRNDPRAPACLVRRLYRYATGHVETSGEEPAIAAVTKSFAESGYRFRDLAVALVASDGFRFAADPLP